MRSLSLKALSLTSSLIPTLYDTLFVDDKEKVNTALATLLPTVVNSFLKPSTKYVGAIVVPPWCACSSCPSRQPSSPDATGVCALCAALVHRLAQTPQHLQGVAQGDDRPLLRQRVLPDGL